MVARAPPCSDVVGLFPLPEGSRRSCLANGSPVRPLCYDLSMRNLEVAFIFNQIADLLEIQGANPFRIRAYRRAALNIEGLADNIETLSLQGTLRNVPGIGEDLANKIDEYLRTGKIVFHEDLKKEVPPGLARLVEIPSVGPKTAKEIYDRFR